MRLLLTDRFCDRAKVTTQTDYFDEKAIGLALRVSKHGVKTWTLMYTAPGGKRVRITLGRYPAMSLAAARTKALEAKLDLVEGQPPQTPSVPQTLRAVTEEYLRREGPELRSIDQRRTALERLVLPVLGDRPMGSIKRSEIVRLLDGVKDNNGPRMASLTLAYISRIFNWHAVRDDNFVSPIVRGMSRLKVGDGRDRVLDENELRQVWAAAADAGTFGRLVQFLLLTAVRRSEAANMTRAELVGNVWTIPASRMKGKVKHVVPLSAAALALLPAEGEWMFPKDDGVGPITTFSTSKERFDRAVPIEPGWTLHDCRRTARSLMAAAQVPDKVAERCLAHKIGGVEGIYNQHKYDIEKRQAFEALAALVERIVRPQANVVALRP